MKIIRKLCLFSFVFIVIFILIGNFNIKVNSGSFIIPIYGNVQVIGAGVRTSGNEGIRFECKAELTSTEYEIKKYGALIAFGSSVNGKSLTVEDLSNAWIDNKTINDHSIINTYTNEADDEGYYYVTIYNVPEDFYLQDITIVPYIVLYSSEGEYETIYGSGILTRNLGEIVLAYLNDGGKETTILSNVKEKLINDYRVTYSDNLGMIYYSSLVYETNLNNIYKEFAEDWNRKYPTKEIHTTIYSNDISYIYSNIVRDDSDYSDFLDFFRNNNKYIWLFEFLKNNLTFSDATYSNIVSNLKGNENILTKAELDFMPKFIYILFDFLTQVDGTSNCEINFKNNKDLYNKFIEYAINNSNIYCDLINNKYDIAKVGEAISLPVSASSIIWSSFQCFDNKEKNSINCYYDSLSDIKIKDDGRYYVFYYQSLNITNNQLINSMLSNQNILSDTLYIGRDDYRAGFIGNLYIKPDASNITFNNINFDDCELICDFGDKTSTGVTITNLTFENCKIGVDTNKKFINWGGDGYCENIKFINCEFYSKNSTSLEYYADSFISVTNNNGMSFTNCTFNNSKNGVIRINKSTNELGEIGTFTIDGCSFYNCLNHIVEFEYLDHANDARLYVSNSTFMYDSEYLEDFSIFNNYVLITILDANRPKSNQDFSRIILKSITCDMPNAYHPYIARYHGAYTLKCTEDSQECKITNHGIDPD